MTKKTTALEVKDLSVEYEGELALEGVTFAINQGTLVAVIGPNGAGKSTLMKAIMEMVPIHRFSHIHVDRSRLGYVPQHQSVDWSFPVTVRDVVMMSLIRQIGWLRWPQKHHWKHVHEALERVEMSDLADRQIGDLSGGQRQRVFIARALAQKSDILLLDEPFAGVDIAAQNSLMNIIRRLNLEDGITILLSTHDLNLAFQQFHQIIAINRRLIAYGSPEELYTTSTLRALYGRAVAALSETDGSQTLLFIDEHHSH